MIRTLENCRLVQMLGKPIQYCGVCEGFAKSVDDDEPCEICKRCKLNNLNQEEQADEQRENRAG